MNSIYILYHINEGYYCHDGLGAAFSAWMKFKDTANYIPVKYGDPFPNIELTKETDIYILDFSYSQEIIDSIKDKVNKLVVIDHHKGVKLELKTFIFDIDKSGSVLAWEYFHPGLPVPLVLKMVQDRDLWLFKLLDTKAFYEGLKYSGRVNLFEYWQELCYSQPELIHLIGKGKSILKAQQQAVKDFVANENNYKFFMYANHTAVIYNTTTLISEIGEAFCNNKELNIDFSVSYAFNANGDLSLSFRSAKSSSIDVSTIAKEFDGNGHEHAAGARLHNKAGMEFLESIYL